MNVFVLDGIVIVNEGIIISVDNGNDGLMFFNVFYNVSVNENVNSGSVFMVSVIDEDGDIVMFSVYGLGSELFLIYVNIGVVFLVDVFDYEIVSGYMLIVWGSDSNGGVVIMLLYVDVVN